MNHRVSEIKEEIRASQYKNPIGRVDSFSGNPPHKGLV
jgi:hypothetical protein